MQHPAIPTTAEMLDRGIYCAPCLDEHGYHLLLAIDSHHRCVHQMRIFAADDLEERADMLMRLLDEKDPQPRQKAA